MSAQEKQPLITVLMAVYNGGNYLLSSVQSILDQTFKDFEFLIIDDCSTDESLSKVRGLNDFRINIHRNDSNLGQTRSLNVGLRMARGQYIARIDADDIAFPFWLEHQVSFIKAHPEAAVVSAKAVVINQKNQIKKVLHTPVSYPEILMKSLTSSPINHVGSLMNKEMALQHGGFDESFKIAADYDLWSKLLAADCKILTNQHIAVAIRVHEESLSIIERGKADILEVTKIMKRNIHRFTGLDLQEADVVLLWNLIYRLEDLSEEDFNRARGLLKEIYGGFNSSRACSITADFIKDFASSQDKIIFVKRIFALSQKNVVKEVERLTGVYISEYGWLNLFGLVRILSLLGRRFLFKLPGLYDYGRSVIAHFVVDIKVSKFINRKNLVYEKI